jgi:N-methylhydantoinase B/oxoprolinase/acetone carboxylase alpha subunit
VIFAACSNSNQFGQKVNEPFSGNKYESSNRFFRSVGKGDSRDENVAKSKADLQAKAELAKQVNTNVKAVADQYLMETEVNNASEINDKFQSLTREVTNTSISDLRKIGEEKYYDAEKDKYTVYIAYEIKKNAMFRFLKKQARTDKRISDAERETIEEIIDQELEKLED